MFKSEAKQIAEDNLRAARDSGDIAAITEALKAYNTLAAKEDLKRERRRRSRAKREREAAKTSEPPPFDGDEEFIEDDYKPYIPPPKPVALPPLAPPPALAVEAPATPAAQLHGSGYTIVRKSAGLPWDLSDSPSCGPQVDDLSFAVFAPPQRAVTHAYSGGEWDELRARDARTAEEADWQDRCAKLFGR